MLSRKLTLILSVSLVLLFVIILAFSFFGGSKGSGMRVVTERKADPEALLRGGKEDEKPYRVMPGDTININTADALQFQRLPGIGSALAEAAVAWREENGPFRVPSDLMKVPGIGEEIYSAVSEYIITGDQ